MKKSIVNGARVLLNRIGGLASLVAGAHGHYIADKQPAKRARTRGRTGGGTYGRNLKDHFDQVRQKKKLAAKALKEARNA